MTLSTSNEAAQVSQPAPSATKKPELNPPSPSASTASTLPVDNPSCACGSTTIDPSKTPLTQIDTKTASVRSRPSQEQDKKQESLHKDVDNTAEFSGEVATNNELPSPELVKKIGEFMVLDKDGKSLPFRNIYSGPNVVRRVLVIFIRHFFCGNCQEYIRTLSATPSLSPSNLLSQQPPTFICVIGCGSPSLIPMYTEQTSCPYPVYTDPTKQLYTALQMIRTLNYGKKQPEYMTKSMFGLAVQSVVQGFKQVGKGTAFKHGEWGGGDLHQVGGEFLFESKDSAGFSPGGISPGETPDSNTSTPRLGSRKGDDYLRAGARKEDEKIVTWCHRMRNTRDHAEIKELLRVLGVDAEAERKRKELGDRKLTGVSTRSMSASIHDADQEKEKEVEAKSEVVVR